LTLVIIAETTYNVAGLFIIIPAANIINPPVTNDCGKLIISASLKYYLGISSLILKFEGVKAP
jgi:hypothetical protein